MSDLLRNTDDGEAPQPSPRPKPNPRPVTMSSLSIVEADECSSDSSADSSASLNTIRPSSSEEVASASHWTKFFDQEFYFDVDSDTQKARYHVYFTPPTDVKKGPLFICHHGAGSCGLSFALFTRELRKRLPDAGVLSLEARNHGSIVTNPQSGEEIVDFSLATMTADAETMINMTKQELGWTQLPPTVLLGHSLGGSIVTQLAVNYALGNAIIGYCVIDFVEGYAIEALQQIASYLATRPKIFSSLDEAVQWHVRTRTIRNPESAAISVPSMLTRLPSGKYVWKTDYSATQPWWDGWFRGQSQKFLTGRGAKELILAGTDRLDKDLMIGQMQGKFQLVVVPEAGHFVQEDVPEKTAQLLVEFFGRNDRSAMVLPPKVSDLLAQGKKV
ncbi:Protein phosphatase methylesterase 1 [Recurvomyces mirabilis]|uniref:Protein phosphatase methylesterase 1 n=1 Tax=Recurvomyces mirabilis TaxID=574656 RepID=A0AAE0WPU1_9PEZI|nr:Protein phosphatase methylesterase 1 [Recurvomyces mirabilis]KAK5156057.1 Protein phosphatase methylesterase 1 [Recurvomyces mirabilis]